MFSKNYQTKLFILIAPSFHASELLSILKEGELRRVHTTTVGLTPCPIVSRYGLTVQPDLAVSEFEQLIAIPELVYRLVLIGGIENASLLLADPRIHQICQKTIDRRCQLMVSPSAQPAFLRSGVVEKTTARILPPLESTTHGTYFGLTPLSFRD